MTCIMTFVITVYTYGFDVANIPRWLSLWSFVFPFAFLVSQFVSPIVLRLTAKIVET